MNVSGPFIRRPIGTSLLAIGLLLLGATAYFFLPVAPLPQVDFPTIGVNASLPGVDPATGASSLALIPTNNSKVFRPPLSLIETQRGSWEFIPKRSTPPSTAASDSANLDYVRNRKINIVSFWKRTRDIKAIQRR